MKTLNIKPEEIITGLYRFTDTCNVYLLRGLSSCIAIDFGSGAWLKQAKGMGLPPLKRVYLTHHHEDQCAGLLKHRDNAFTIHAPAGEEAYLSPRGVQHFWKHRRDGGVPSSYSVLRRGLAGIQYDMTGFTEHFWENRRIRFITTPGHGPSALSVLVDCSRKQVVFCGDAAHDGATIWQPYCLEWDHWTGNGALAASQGVKTLVGIGIDLLCPSHGPIVDYQPRRMLSQLTRKLQKFADTKGAVCPGEKDRYAESKPLRCGARQLLENLYQFGENGYLLTGDNRETLVIDPFSKDMPILKALLKELGDVQPTASVATHYHADHLDAMPILKKQYGLTTWLHPIVTEPIVRVGKLDVPWLIKKSFKPDRLLPNRGWWKWNRYKFRVAPFPGQTWWHSCFMANVDDQRVMFAGDNFQPASRWNGTGGFCAMNGCRFKYGFEKSAKLVLDWQPDLLANGHGTYQEFRASQFRKIINWSRHSERVVNDLCPSGQIKTDYHIHKFRDN